MSPRSISVPEVINLLKRMGTSVKIKTEFCDQVDQIDSFLDNDVTGLINTIIDFMVHSATVNFKIEAGNDTLNTFLESWQKNILNKGINIDIPRGLRELTSQNMRERFRSSFLGMKVQWEEMEVKDIGNLIVPKNMWFLDGKSLTTKPNSDLGAREYEFKAYDNNIPLKNTLDESIYIRKPYCLWHKSIPSPYLVKRGILFNALLKKAILEKEADTIESVIFYLMIARAGNDKLAEMDLLPDEEEFRKLKEKIVKAKVDNLDFEGLKDYIATLRYDVNFEHLIPELQRIINQEIFKPIDKNLLSGLGLIELQGFSSTRQEAILNPKVLVEEVVDAVLDWATLLEEVMMDFIEKNNRKHTKIFGKGIQVIPGIIKAFLTDDMLSMIRSLYDRGLFSKQDTVESFPNLFNYMVQKQRRVRESLDNDSVIMKPPVIQNLEQYQDVELTDQNLEDQNKKPGSPEADNFNNTIFNAYLNSNKKYNLVTCKNCDLTFDYNKIREVKMGYILCPKCNLLIDQSGKVFSKQNNLKTYYETIDDLPNNIKNPLPTAAQIIWLKTFNGVIKETNNDEQARQVAWSKVKTKYYKYKNGNWKKKNNF